MASKDVTVSLPVDPDRVVDIWTDGGCKPNPGPGGWSAIMVYRGVEKELSGYEPETTNNRMELTAAAAALETLKRPCEVRLYTDSEYLKNGITRWHQRRILDAAAAHQVEWHWVRSHVGIPLNERADKLATQAREDGVAQGRQRR